MQLSRDRLGGEEHDFSERVEPILNIPTVSDQQIRRLTQAPHTLASLAALGELSGVNPTTPDSVVLSSHRFKQSSEANSDDQAQWYVVAYVKFKPGAAHEARQIISEHFSPVDRALNRTALSFDFHVGEWDRVVYFQMNDVASQLAWMPGPMMASWLENFYRRAGGKDNGDGICKRYNELVERCKTELAVATF